MNDFDNLDYDVQEALIEWYNVVDPDDEAKQDLADLYNEGNFEFWNCPECSTPCLVGRPDDWDNFQGVWQSETLGELCQDCADTYLRLKEYAGGC